MEGEEGENAGGGWRGYMMLNFVMQAMSLEQLDGLVIAHRFFYCLLDENGSKLQIF